MKSKLSSYLVLVVTSLLVAAPYIIVSNFAGIVPMVHFTLLWVFWLTFSRRFSNRMIFLIAPILTFFLYWMPSPNYWRDILNLDIVDVWNDYKLFSGFHENSSDDLVYLVFRNALYFVTILVLVIVSGRAAHKIRTRPTGPNGEAELDNIS